MPPALTRNASLPAEAIVEEAAEWLVRLSDAGARAEDFADFESWKHSDIRRAEAAGRMTDLIDRIKGLRHAAQDTRPLHATLEAVAHPTRKSPRSRRLGATLVLALTLALPGWLVLQKYPAAYLLADVRTAAGQPETRQLADHTQLTLKGASAVNLHFDKAQRRVELVEGEILLQVARDPARPFVVETPQGSIRALGTLFAVRLHGGNTTLTMLESRTSVWAAGAPPEARRVVSAGQRLELGADGLGPVQTIDVGSVADAWKHHQLVVQDTPLPEVLDELARQRTGFIRYDASALAGIRVSAVLPLDDTDQALRLLSTSHHLRLRGFTPWLVTVDRPVAP